MIYKVSYNRDVSFNRDECVVEHDGYRYYGTKREADEAVRRDSLATVKDTSVVPVTKAGVIALLNRWGGHPDNG
jgi:hypothetical protein